MWLIAMLFLSYSGIKAAPISSWGPVSSARRIRSSHKPRYPTTVFVR